MKTNWIIALLASVIIYPGCAVAQQGKPDRNEQRIIKAIADNYDRNIQVLKESVNINSGSLNIQGVRATGDHLAKEFQKIGFKTEWVELPDSLKRAGHLVAYKKGTKGKRVMMIGHLDTVFEPDMEANPFRMLNDSVATGQGISDMKGGNVVILAACQALEQLGLLKDATVIAYFTGDEESTGKPYQVTRRDFIERGQEIDVALGFEGAAGLGEVVVGRRGIGSWTVNVEANQGHSSTIFGKIGYGAAYEMGRILNEFRLRLAGIRNLTLNPGIVVAGVDINAGTEENEFMDVTGKMNIVAPRAVSTGDLRYLTNAQRDSARNIMKEIVSNSLPGTKATITFNDGFPGMEPTAGNVDLVRQLNEVSMDLGYGPVKGGDPGSRGAGDISWITQYTDCIDGLGAEGAGAHAPGEVIYFNTYRPLMERAAVLLYRLTR